MQYLHIRKLLVIVKGLIKITLFSDSDYLKIDISDKGKGLQKANFKRIFEPGFTTKKRGWGLGLSLSKRIIEEYHLGRLYVKKFIKRRDNLSYFSTQKLNSTATFTSFK